jgi:hypothetical protein
MVKIMKTTMYGTSGKRSIGEDTRIGQSGGIYLVETFLQRMNHVKWICAAGEGRAK